MKRFRSTLASTPFRLGLLSFLFLGASVGGLFYLFHWAAAGFLDRQMAATIDADAVGFMDSYRANGMIGLANAVAGRAHVTKVTNGNAVYLLENQTGTTIAGNVRSWPPHAEDTNNWLNFTMSDLRTPQRVADVRAKQYPIPGGGRLLVGRDVSRAPELRERLFLSLYAGLALAVVMGGLGGYVVGRTRGRGVLGHSL